MFGSFIRSALRNFARYRTQTAINVVGLSVGIAACMIVASWVGYELSYDRYHSDHERIFRVALDSQSETELLTSSKTSAPLVAVLKENYPQIESATHILQLGEGVVRYKEQAFHETGRVVADQSFFLVFGTPFVRGNRIDALIEPNTAVVTEDIASRYFGEENPVGKILNINSQDYKVTGVVPDVPSNSHLKYRIVISLATIIDRYPMSAWGLANFFTYVKIREATDLSEFSQLLSCLEENYVPRDQISEGDKSTYFLQPVTDIHLGSNLLYEAESPGNPMHLLVFSLVGSLVFAIAFINFINLASTRAVSRAREMGVRKISGALQHHLLGQALVESSMLAIFSGFGSLLILELVKHELSLIAGSERIAIGLGTGQFTLLLTIMVAGIGIGGGLYTASFCSSFKISRMLRGEIGSGPRTGRLIRLLVVFQFVASIGMMICAMVVHDQIGFMRQYDLGFSDDRKLIIPGRGGINLSESFQREKTDLLKVPGVIEATASSESPGQDMDYWTVWPVNGSESEALAMHFTYVDHDFIPNLEMELLTGNNFSEISSVASVTDSTLKFIVNETAVAAFSLGDAKTTLGLEVTNGRMTGEIVGVVADYHTRGLQDKVGPLVMVQFPERFRKLILTISSDDIAQTIAATKKVWDKAHPSVPFSYDFLDEQFNRQYEKEEMVGELFSWLTGLGIFIACIGLLGLASHAVERRTKEIGVRKVLGASVASIVRLVSKEFILLVATANLIAWPTAYVLMDRWLQDFAFHTEIEVPTFMLASALALSIALATVAYQAIRAATANPVESLKCE